MSLVFSKNVLLTVIGGVGYNETADHMESKTISTVYGNVSVLFFSISEGNEIAFISRHQGKNHVPPHKINFLSLIEAAKQIKAPVLAVNSVGIMRNIPLISNKAKLSSSPDSQTGDLIVTPERFSDFPFFIPEDFIDMTKNRIGTFYDEQTVHTDMTDPYCSHLRNLICSIFDEKEISYSKGIYLCTQGPRFETKAEIQMYAHFADVVGMTGVPEVVLAKEAGLCYASVCVISNPASGLGQNMLTADEVKESVKKTQKKVFEIISDLAISLKNQKTDFKCFCKKATLNGKL